MAKQPFEPFVMVKGDRAVMIDNARDRVKYAFEGFKRADETEPAVTPDPPAAPNAPEPPVDDQPSTIDGPSPEDEGEPGSEPTA